MTIAVTQNGITVVGFSIESRTDTQVVIDLPGSASGDNLFCVTVSDGTTPDTVCTTAHCAGCPAVLDV